MELLSCSTDDPDSCETVAYFEAVSADVGTEECTNSYADPETALGPPDGGQFAVALQGGWVAGEFGLDTPIMSGMIVRVYEVGTSGGGSNEPFTAHLITDLACAESGDISDCGVSLGEGFGLTDFVVP